MILSNATLVSLAEAHLNLDGSPDKPFVFSAKFRYALVKNLRLLQQRVRDLDRARMDLIKELAPEGQKIEKDTPEAVAFHEKYSALLDSETEIPLFQLKLSDLNLEANAIPVRVLSALGPIMVEDVDFA